MTISMTTPYPSSATPSPSDKRSRRKLVQRAIDNLPPLRVTRRDLEIIAAVYEHRALTSQQIQQLLFPADGGNERARLVHCQQRLKVLYHHGYLLREEEPTRLSEGRRPLIYYLDRKGATILTDFYGCELDDLDWQPRNNMAGTSDEFKAHLLQENQVRLTLTLAARQLPGVEIMRWLSDRTLKRDHAKEVVTFTAAQGSKQEALVIPDGYFHLICPGQDAQGRPVVHSYHFFVEVDLATVTGQANESQRRSWDRKVRALLAYYHEYYQKRYNTSSLRILIITTSERRRRRLQEITQTAGGRNRFWFTTFDQLTANTALTQAIWSVASKGEELRALIE